MSMVINSNARSSDVPLKAEPSKSRVRRCDNTSYIQQLEAVNAVTAD